MPAVYVGKYKNADSFFVGLMAPVNEYGIADEGFPVGEE